MRLLIGKRHWGMRSSMMPNRLNLNERQSGFPQKLREIRLNLVR